MAEKLTPQQRQAVEDRGGRLLVSAAAGSGKTAVGGNHGFDKYVFKHRWRKTGGVGVYEEEAGIVR